jgi:drug/metabolite transporter (DMT)-like permease
MEAASARHRPASHESRGRAFRIGVTLAVINTIIGAAQPPLTRWGAVHLDPLLFCTGAVVFATACIVPTLYLRGELSHIFAARYRRWLFAMSMAGTVMTSLTLTFGLTRIGAVAGVLLLQTEPIYSILLATIFVGERPSVRQLIATATILLGIGSVFGAGGVFFPLWAAALVFITPLFWQTSHVMGLRVMPPLTPPSITGGRFIYAAVVLTALLLATRPATLAELADARAVGVIAVTGFFVYFLSALTWYSAISRLSLAWTTALVVPAVPLLSILFSVLFLGEHATAREVIGVLIAITGVLALVLGADAHRQHVPPTEVIEAIHQPLS